MLAAWPFTDAASRFVTAPIIEREDGSYLMESLDIAKWLDEAFPDRPNLFLPEASLPVDVASAEYADALKRGESFEGTREALFKPLFRLFAPHIVKTFDEEVRPGLVLSSDLSHCANQVPMPPPRRPATGRATPVSAPASGKASRRKRLMTRVRPPLLPLQQYAY